ncbi:MAG: IS91 family transposase [Natronospirillum sp.]
MSNVTIQHILNDHGDAYLKSHRLPLYKHKALWSIRHCRTSQMGSHADVCINGHIDNVHYNSCRHRSCPQCQFAKSQQWLQKQQARLLNTTHHHWVFTVPHELLPLWRYHQTGLQDLLFQAVQLTLKQLWRDTRYLGGKPGVILALHTWGRNLSLHPHIHCLISHGGWSTEGLWREPKRKVMFPAKVMRRLFRGKFLHGLKQALNAGTLQWPDAKDHIEAKDRIGALYQQDWVVHCCKPYSQGEDVAKYLARYMRGGALRNGQLLVHDSDKVVFRYKSHRTQQTERMRLPPDALISRLLTHVPLPGKPTVRMYGLYHPNSEELLNSARAHFKQTKVHRPEPLNWREWLVKKHGQPLCHRCQAPIVGFENS